MEFTQLDMGAGGDGELEERTTRARGQEGFVSGVLSHSGRWSLSCEPGGLNRPMLGVDFWLVFSSVR